MSIQDDQRITGQLKQVIDDIEQAAIANGRSVDAVKLVAVSKTFPAEIIRSALEAGQRTFGENRVQEAAGKWPALKKEYSGVALHLIGPLQTNKTAAAVALFDCIETLDRPKLARAISVELHKQQKQIELFIQVNTGKEPQKAGIAPEDLSSFLDFCQDELSLSISGLMCIPPFDQDPAQHFLMLAGLAKSHDLANLSMGMSADYKKAVAFGATHVRVGSAIFGKRKI